MLNQYETVFIVTPVLSEEQMKEAVKKFSEFISSNGGDIVQEDNWGLRKLAYPIQKKSTGFYHLVEFKAEGDTSINGIGSIDIDDFAASVNLAKRHAKGIDLPEEWVPCSTYWLICQNRIVGTCNLRHELNDFLREFGGHVGFSVRPSERNKGYGTQMLRFVLKKAQELGIMCVLVTCDDNNIASAQVIEKNDGKFADKVTKDDSQVTIRRYWIDLSVGA